MAYCDEISEALAATLRPAKASSNTAADHITVIEHALLQIPAEQIENTEILVRTDSAGATHGLLDFCREHRLRFSVGYELTDPVGRDPRDPRGRVGRGIGERWQRA